MKTEVIQPHPDRFGAWYFFNFKKYGGYKKSWIERYDREIMNHRKRV